ncbi:hypothetical protein TURU_149949 [Turdus rufiventris]|nr:hypothetical protein TURU_149949 [Turdus rufiventris]
MLCLMPPQDRVGPPGSRALPAHVQLVIDQDSQVPFHGTALQPLIPQSVCISRVVSFQVQNLALALVEPHMGGDCPSLIYRGLSSGPLHLPGNQEFLPLQYHWKAYLALDEGDEEHRTEDGALWNTTSDRPPV